MYVAHFCQPKICKAFLFDKIFASSGQYMWLKFITEGWKSYWQNLFNNKLKFDEPCDRQKFGAIR